MLSNRMNRIERLFDNAAGGPCITCMGGQMTIRAMQRPDGEIVPMADHRADEDGCCRRCGRPARKRIIVPAPTQEAINHE